MIKFFRHIRQRLLGENKFSKYLLYAIGEIVLVMIGILLALQVSHWNNERIKEKRADAFVEKLKIQTNNNLTHIDYYIERLEFTYNISIQLLSLFDTHITENIDTKMDSLVGVNVMDYHLNLDMNTITEGKENGDMALLTSDTLRQALYNLSTNNITLIERERISNEDLNLLFVPYLKKNYNTRNFSRIKDIGKSKLYKGDNSRLLDSQEFENHIISRLQYNASNIRVYNMMKTNLEEILQLLLTY